MKLECDQPPSWPVHVNTANYNRMFSFTANESWKEKQVNQEVGICESCSVRDRRFSLIVAIEFEHHAQMNSQIIFLLLYFILNPFHHCGQGLLHTSSTFLSCNHKNFLEVFLEVQEGVGGIPLRILHENTD